VVGELCRYIQNVNAHVSTHNQVYNDTYRDTFPSLETTLRVSGHQRLRWVSGLNTGQTTLLGPLKAVSLSGRLTIMELLTFHDAYMIKKPQASMTKKSQPN
jgi:hypothetical protein